MTSRSDFQDTQYRFAAHIRNPELNPAPEGVEDRRMAIYRDLFFNNVSKLLAGTFPVIHKILGKERWAILARDYFANHQAHTPLFLEMPKEFIQYLSEERENNDEDPPFLIELAHYEWVELALSIEEFNLDLDNVDRNGDPFSGVPVLSPLARTLSYQYPVHRIRPDFQPSEPPEEPTFLVVYRDQEDKVGFLEINAVTARLLELMKDEKNVTGHDILQSIAEQTNHPKPDTVINGGREILAGLRRRDIVLGTKRHI